MHKELYGEYEEFQEADMVLDDRIKLRFKDYENNLNQQWKAREQETQTKIIELWKRGYTPEEVKKMLAEEDKSEKVILFGFNTPPLCGVFYF
jgi:hypothetical protein